MPVDRDRRDTLRKLRGQNGVAADVKSLLSGLADAAHDDIVDRRRINPRPFYQGVENAGGQVCRMPALESSPFSAARGPGSSIRLDGAPAKS